MATRSKNQSQADKLNLEVKMKKNDLDIEGVQRGVVGYSKTPNEYGEKEAVVEYELKPIALNKLREIFNTDTHKAISDTNSPKNYRRPNCQNIKNHL